MICQTQECFIFREDRGWILGRDSRNFFDLPRFQKKRDLQNHTSFHLLSILNAPTM